MPPVDVIHAGSFNSRLREEATVQEDANDFDAGGFNSRLREEATTDSSSPPNPYASFNSRLREEATRHPEKRRLPHGSFNSRLREEATGYRLDFSVGVEVSTHASVRRRPLPAGHDVGLMSVSTHASVRRRQARMERRNNRKQFQLTPP